jgi:hypothetical protein
MRAELSIALVLMFLLLANGGAMAATSDETRAAFALSNQFETVFYTDSTLLTGDGPYRGLSEQDSNALRVPFAYLQAGLRAIDEGAPAELLRNADAVLVGVKDFRAPSGLGSVRSQFCFVVAGNGRGGDVKKFFASRTPVATMGNISIWNWSAELGEFGEKDRRASLLFATRIPNSYTVISNSLDEIKTTVSSLQTSGLSSIDSKWTHEWALLSQYDVWGYRRYRHTGVVDREAAGMADVTPGAEALVFVVDVGKKTCTLRLLSSDENTPAKLSERTLLPRLERLPDEPGVWLTVIRLTGDQESNERMFVVMGLFGFAIYA